MNIPKDDGEPSGTLRLGLPQVVADVALFDIAVGLKAAFPGLDLRCRTEWSSGLQLQVTGGELDAAAVMVPSWQHAASRHARPATSRRWTCWSCRAGRPRWPRSP
jgi:DNA-binding transcriptional LysR family regulator